MGIWHYEKLVKNPRTGEARLEKVEVPFSADQCATDEQILRRFESVELLVSKGQSVKGTPAVRQIQDLLDGVPTERALHWTAELERIGAIDAPKKAEEKKETPATGAGK